MIAQYGGSNPLRSEVMAQLAELQAGDRQRIILILDIGLLIFRPTNYPRGGLVGITDDNRDIYLNFDRPTEISIT